MAFRHLATYSVLATAALLPAQTIAGQPIEWPIADGGNGHFYQFVGEEVVSWETARDAAAAASYAGLSGHLVTIANAAENDFVVSVVGPEAVWLGMTDAVTEGTFQWITGEPLTFTNWSPGEPNNLGDEDCGDMHQRFAPGDWNDYGCSLTRYYVIEFEAPTLTCVGFDPPMNAGPVTVRGGNRALPLKAALLTEGVEIIGSDLASPPVIQVLFDSSLGGGTIDVTNDVLPAGQGTDGNQFVYSGGKWQFNLLVKDLAAPGTYTITMESGDDDEYAIDPTCEAHFVVE
jgi:lectin-like protein